MELVNNANNDHFCHDCSEKMIVDGEDIKNGVFLTYDNSGEKINIFKCNECFTKNKALTNFRECEVYSRVVGYIRPVGQWHKGKRQEYSERKEYNMPGENLSYGENV